MIYELPTVVISWPEGSISIQSKGQKAVLPLTHILHVIMLDLDNLKDEKTMVASELGEYMSAGYIIEQIVVEQ